MADWKTRMFMHGALTEWIFWDEIVASKVERIEYRTFSNPPQIDQSHCPPRLEDVIPQVVKAGRHDATTKRGMSRSVLHADIYDSPESVEDDHRAPIDDMTLAKVWEIVQRYEHRNLMFVWILSMLQGKYYLDSIVERIVVRYPQVIEESLELVTRKSPTSGDIKNFLVHTESGQFCRRRVDVNSYQTLMLACVKSWYQMVGMDKKHVFHGVDVYIVTGRARPYRNLVRLHRNGFFGGCRTECLRNRQKAGVFIRPFDCNVTALQKLNLLETCEQHRFRLISEGNDICYVPEGIELPLAKRVRKVDKSHLSQQPK